MTLKTKFFISPYYFPGCPQNMDTKFSRFPVTGFFFFQSFEVRTGNIDNSLEYGKCLLQHLGFCCLAVSFGWSTNSMIWFQKMAIYPQVLSLYEFHRFTI